MSCDSNKDQVKKERTNRISSYDRLIELNMILLYTLYSEKDRRLYGAAEALKLGYGGIRVIFREFWVVIERRYYEEYWSSTGLN
jgi:hypothetical protein